MNTELGVRKVHGLVTSNSTPSMQRIHIPWENMGKSSTRVMGDIVYIYIYIYTHVFFLLHVQRER